MIYLYFAGEDAKTANYGPWTEYEDAAGFVLAHPTLTLTIYQMAVEIDMNRLELATSY